MTSAQYFFIGYKLVHLVGVLLLFLALGGMVFRALVAPPDERKGRLLGYVLHGVALFLVLLGGFGLMARTGIQHGEPWPAWITTKFGVWLALGGFVAVFKRLPRRIGLLWPLVPVLGAVAVFAAVTKFGSYG